MTAVEPNRLDAQAAHRYAIETSEMAHELWRYVFPPWRWGKWWRLSREVDRRLKLSREAREWRAEHWDEVLAYHRSKEPAG